MYGDFEKNCVKLVYRFGKNYHCAVLSSQPMNTGQALECLPMRLLPGSLDKREEAFLVFVVLSVPVGLSGLAASSAIGVGYRRQKASPGLALICLPLSTSQSFLLYVLHTMSRAWGCIYWENR